MQVSSHQKNKAGGFAYLWLLFLVAAISFGTLVSSEWYATQVQREKERELLMIGRQFRTAIASYYQAQLPPGSATSNVGTATSSLMPQFSGSQDLRRYPTSLNDLLLDGRFPGIRRHLRKLFVDPMTGRADWGLVIVGGRIVGVHSVSERSPIKQAGFDLDEAQLNGASQYRNWEFVYPSNLNSVVPSNTALSNLKP